jgi:hypothetical protein
MLPAVRLPLDAAMRWWAWAGAADRSWVPPGIAMLLKVWVAAFAHRGARPGTSGRLWAPTVPVKLSGRWIWAPVAPAGHSACWFFRRGCRRPWRPPGMCLLGLLALVRPMARLSSYLLLLAGLQSADGFFVICVCRHAASRRTLSGKGCLLSLFASWAAVSTKQVRCAWQPR